MQCLTIFFSVKSLKKGDIIKTKSFRRFLKNKEKEHNLNTILLIITLQGLQTWKNYNHNECIAEKKQGCYSSLISCISSILRMNFPHHINMPSTKK